MKTRFCFPFQISNPRCFLPRDLVRVHGEPLNLVQTIPLPGVKGRFDHFSIDAKGKRLFVAALGNNTVEVIELAEGKRIHSISGMSKPQGVLFLAHRNELFVANGDDGTLKVLDPTDFTVKNKFTEMPDVDNVRADPHTGEVWAGYGEGALVRVLVGMHQSTFELAGHPESFQLEKQGWRVFVNVPDAKQIAVIDAKKQSVVTNWTVSTSRFPIAETRKPKSASINPTETRDVKHSQKIFCPVRCL